MLIAVPANDVLRATQQLMVGRVAMDGLVWSANAMASASERGTTERRRERRCRYRYRCLSVLIPVWLAPFCSRIAFGPSGLGWLAGLALVGKK